MKRKVGGAWQDAIRRAAAAPGVINLGGGLPADAQFPRAELSAAFTRVLQAGAGQALQYGWVEGQAQLRDRIAERLRARGARVSADDIVVTNGAQQALSLATDLLLPAGAKVGVEAATYPAALTLFRSRRLTPVALPDGRATYVQTTLNNPTGTALPEEDYRSLARRRSAVIEDDAYGDLTFVPDGRAPFLVTAPRRTYHVGTFSKTLCPGLRVGWLVVPRVARERARHLKETDDLQANSLAQAVVNDYLGHVDFDRRVEVLRRYYRGRAARLAEALHRAVPAWRFRFPQGGFCLWIETDAAVDERRFAELALEEGVSFDPGSDFQVGRAAGAPTTLRLCFSYVSPARFGAGARRLARAWRRAVVKRSTRSRAR
ncbi:MAG TPA: PLP-dependent aminotransferase family protein [Polyangia bacterium]